MSYKLAKPCTDKERVDFIVEYNHEKGLRIEETDSAIFALFENEIMKDGIPVEDENYESFLISRRQDIFEREFFKTSIGWIRRKVNMLDGTTKDFLSDLLLQIKAGLELGQSVEIITYREPDYTQEIDDEYIISLQERKVANSEFIEECLLQTVKDFGG